MLKTPDTLNLFPLVTEDLVLNVGGRTLINRLSFTIYEQGITAIMGPNGAGKSLTLRLLHGLINPSSGIINWNNAQNLKEIQRSQAMVFQKPVLLRRSVIENLRYILKVKKVTTKTKQAPLINEALRRSNLTEQANNPARTLSGGEQQKLAMASALMTRPKILFLDEPTASLDPGATLIIENLIKTAEANGTKIIMITHDIGQAKRLASDILFLNNGQVAEQGPAAELINQPSSKAGRQYFSGEIVLS